MDDSFIQLLPTWVTDLLGNPSRAKITWVSIILLAIVTYIYHSRGLQAGEYIATTSQNYFGNRSETGYHFYITRLKLNGCYSSEKGGACMKIFKHDSLVCSIGIGYTINTKVKMGRFYYDPNALDERDDISDETINEFLRIFYANGIQIEQIKVLEPKCSMKAEWRLDPYNNGKISISKSP